MGKTAEISNKGVRLVQRVGSEIEANFAAWVDRNFVDRRAGRIGDISYSRAGALDDIPGDTTWYADAHARAWADYNEPASYEELEYIVSHPLIALQLSVGITDLRGLRCLRRGLSRRVNALQQRAYRSRYYARDNARRRLLAAERRKISRRTTLNPCPTADEFRDAFARVGKSVAAKIRFGGLVHDLECYVDNCLRIDERGEIVGRNGGIKAWLADNVPELQCRYKTIMRYKALAKRVRQAVGVTDPVPTDVLLEGINSSVPLDDLQGGAPCGVRTDTASTKENFPLPMGGALKKDSAFRAGKVSLNREHGDCRAEDRQDGHSKAWISGVENYYACKSHAQAIHRARRRVSEIFAACDNTILAIFGRVDAELERLETRGP